MGVPACVYLQLTIVSAASGTAVVILVLAIVGSLGVTIVRGGAAVQADKSIRDPQEIAALSLLAGGA